MYILVLWEAGERWCIRERDVGTCGLNSQGNVYVSMFYLLPSLWLPYFLLSLLMLSSYLFYHTSSCPTKIIAHKSEREGEFSKLGYQEYRVASGRDHN